MTDYRQNPDRLYLQGLSGIYVRALNHDGKWVNADILTLDDESFHAFVGRDIDWAADCASALAERLREAARAH